jgi:uncharacterized protein (DUF1697 family)
MLRGINVTGHNTIKMQDLRTVCNKLGYRNVQTYVQSGNIVFETTKESPAQLSKQLSKAIRDAQGFDVPVFIRTVDEMKKIVSANPFLKERNIDTSKLHVTFLSEAPKAGSLQNLEKIPAEPDRFHAVQNEIYLSCPEGYGRTKLSNTMIEKTLSVGATTRNWRTSNTLLEMASKPTSEKN